MAVLGRFPPRQIWALRAWKQALFVLAAAMAQNASAQEGDTLHVARLAFQGNRTLSTSALKLLMNTRKSPWYAGLPGVKHRRFDAAAFRADVGRIQNHYRDLGYYDAGIDTVVDRSTPGAVGIHIHIREGQAVHVDSIRVIGLSDVPDMDVSGLSDNLLTRQGQPLRRSDLEADRDHIQEGLQNSGYAFASVSAQVSVRREECLADVTLLVSAGPLCRFGNVTVEGNQHIPEKVVRKGLSFRSGARYRKRMLLNSQRQLYRSGAFRSVGLGAPDSAAQVSPVDVVVSVTERPRRRLKVGVGVASEENVRASLMWQHRNFLGGARQLTFQTSASWLETGANLGIRQPYIWGNRNWLNVNAFIRREDRRTFLVRRVGAAASVERDVRSAASLVFQTTAEWVDFSADSTLTSFRAAYQEDTRDDLFDPRSGLLMSLALEESGRFFRSNREFLRLTGEWRWYARIVAETVLAMRISGGIIWRLRGAGDVLNFKRFYAGGSNSVRGWSLNQLGPRDTSGALTGGRSLVEGSLELRPRLFGAVGAAFFLDAGNVGRRHGAFNPAELRWAAGLGLRYLSPVGPLRIDAARRLSEDVFAGGQWRFYFSLGQAF